MSHEESSIGAAGAYLVTTAACIPPAPVGVSFSGTITASGTAITGSGTAFISELCSGGNALNLKYRYIYVASINNVREIDYVKSDSMLVLKKAFSAAVVAQALVCPDNKFRFKEISLVPLGAGNIMCGINDSPLTMSSLAGMTFRWEGGLTPIAINGGGTGGIQITQIL